MAPGWPPGLEALLKAGADPVVAAEDAIRYGDNEAMSSLLKYECPMSYGEGDDILIDKLKSSPLKRQTIKLAIAKSADQRQRLWALAQENLLALELGKLKISLQKGEVLDADCVVVQNALSSQQIYVPPSLKI